MQEVQKVCRECRRKCTGSAASEGSAVGGVQEVQQEVWRSAASVQEVQQQVCREYSIRCAGSASAGVQGV